MAVDEFGREIPSAINASTALPSSGGFSTGGYNGGPSRLESSSLSTRRRSPSPPIPSASTYYQQQRYPQHKGFAPNDVNHYGNSNNQRYNQNNYGRINSKNIPYEQRQLNHRSNPTQLPGGRQQGFYPNKDHFNNAPMHPDNLPSQNQTTGIVPGVSKHPQPAEGPNDDPELELRKLPHPSFLYVDEPLLCQFVWKSLDTNANEEAMESSLPHEGLSGDVRIKNEENNDEIETKMTYDEYRKRYCLNYIRAFFNKHLDDSWFRQRYSPLVRKHAVYEQEQTRAIAEASTFVELIMNTRSTLETFLKDVRLGGGIKQIHIPSSVRRNPHHQELTPVSSAGNLNTDSNVPPLQHLFSFQHRKELQATYEQSLQPKATSNSSTQFALHVMDIPPYATDEHIAQAIVDFYNTLTRAKHAKLLALEASKNGPEEELPTPPNSASTKPGGTSKATTIPMPALLRMREIKVYPAPATLIANEKPWIAMKRQVLVAGPCKALIEIIINSKQLQDSKMSALDAFNEANVALPPPGGAGFPAPIKRSVPRKGVLNEGDITFFSHPEHFYGPFDLEVECSDPYNRAEYDNDGRGNGMEENPVRNRKVKVGICPVFTSVSTAAVSAEANDNVSNPSSTMTSVIRKQQQPQFFADQRRQQHRFATKTIVLSAAVSSKSRIEQDLKSAKLIARILDKKKRIPKEYRFDRVSNYCLLQGVESSGSEDLLDVCIAYLRRVHLISFYDMGSYEAETIGDVLAGKHPSSNVHLRLQNADEYMKKSKKEENTTIENSSNNLNSNEKEEVTDKASEAELDSNPIDNSNDTIANEVYSKDILVQRLDESISKALQYCKQWDGDENEGTNELVTLPGMIDEQTEEDSKQIEILEEQVKNKWLMDHTVNDDGRARCSFSKCRKLFKDSVFLEKHLLKYHTEHLRAEQAKCHDEFMMRTWDNCLCRPVPSIWVDCGSHFGCVEVNIISGQVEADVVDPEPALWEREEQRRARELEMKRKREELRQQQLNQNNQNFRHKDRNPSAPGGTGGDEQQRSQRVFVDVDDMKVEKVELKFDTIEVEAVPITATDLLALAKKNKKKKKKLL